MGSEPKDMNPEAWHQLGFEHGYAGVEQSYPQWPEYVKGHVFGVRFRSRVAELAPLLHKERNGKYSVAFHYVGWMMHRDPSEK